MAQLFLTGGKTAARLLRNRGRTRELAARLNQKLLRKRFLAFLAGDWQPGLRRPKAPFPVSLTSWSRRIDDLLLVLLMLIDQDLQPDGVYVWLTGADLEIIAKETRILFEEHGVSFKSCPDYGPHKKWLPMLLDGQRTPFVLCDDDIFYPRDWFRQLISENRDDAYVGCRCHRMDIAADGFPTPYSEWDKDVCCEHHPSHLLFTTGCGGEILYPDRLPDTALDWDAINRCAPSADDIWLKGAHAAGKWPVFKTHYSFPCLEQPGTEETGLLAAENSARNDDQIRAVWDYFKIRDKL